MDSNEKNHEEARDFMFWIGFALTVFSMMYLVVTGWNNRETGLEHTEHLLVPAALIFLGLFSFVCSREDAYKEFLGDKVKRTQAQSFVAGMLIFLLSPLLKKIGAGMLTSFIASDANTFFNSADAINGFMAFGLLLVHWALLAVIVGNFLVAFSKRIATKLTR